MGYVELMPVKGVGSKAFGYSIRGSNQNDIIKSAIENCASPHIWGAIYRELIDHGREK